MSQDKFNNEDKTPEQFALSEEAAKKLIQAELSRVQESREKELRLSNNQLQNGLFPTPNADDIRKFSSSTFGTLGNGSTGMNIFFSDGTQSIYMSPAKFKLVLREVEVAETQKADSVIVPITINKASSNSNSQFISKTVKVALKDAKTDNKWKITGPRVLICQYHLLSEGYTNYTLENSFGIILELSKFRDINTQLFGNPHAINNSGAVDW